MRRMDRYNEEDSTNRACRVDKNQVLYQDVSNNNVSANITDVSNVNAFEIHQEEEKKPTRQSREAYQQMQKYQAVEPESHTKKELEDYNQLYPKRENKVYDINTVLETARKNRTDVDELEEKRKLKNNDYNILSGVNKKELEKYREEKKKRVLTPEEAEIRELIDTIASKTLAGELDKDTTVDLLSDLMATNMFDKVDKMKEEKEENADPVMIVKDQKAEEEKQEKELEKTLREEIIQKELTEEAKEDAKEEKDTEFYTRSMDLSDKDFEMSDDFKEKTLPLWVKLLLFFLIVVVLSLGCIFIYQRIA